MHFSERVLRAGKRVCLRDYERWEVFSFVSTFNYRRTIEAKLLWNEESSGVINNNLH